MRVSHICEIATVVVVAHAGCFSPNPPADLRCASATITCPPTHFCQAGVCRVGAALCDSLGDARTGSGTPDDPYVICTEEQWLLLTERHSSFPWDAAYALGADIHLVRTDDGQSPIGVSATDPFTGTLDGRGHAIFGARVLAPAGSNVGLFGYIDGAPATVAIRDFGVIDIEVSGRNQTGGLAGFLKKATMVRVFATGTVSASGSITGGLLGKTSEGASLEDCYSEVIVTASRGTTHGGLMGQSNGVVKNCYAGGTVRASTDLLGGLIGEVGDTGPVENSFAANDVFATGGAQMGVGQIFGIDRGAASVTNYHDSGAICTIDDAPCPEQTNAQSREQFFEPNTAPLENWDFDATWQTVEGGFPRLRPPPAR